MKKWLKILLTAVLLLVPILLIFDRREKPAVVYLKKPFEIPGPQMAATIPPFGIFIDQKDKDREREENNGQDYFSNCLLAHELVHWDQYKSMGLFSFYKNYLGAYAKGGRKDIGMEEDARRRAKTEHELLKEKYLD